MPVLTVEFSVRLTLTVAITVSSTLLNPGSDRTAKFQNEITTHSYQPLRWFAILSEIALVY